MLVLPPEFTWTSAWFVLPLVLGLLAEAVRVWAVGYAGSATRTRGDTVEDFVHAGPYRHVRNPLYVANIVLYTSAAVLYGFAWLAAILFVYSCVQYHFIVSFEETILSRTFGDRYDTFRAKVPRWLVSPSARIASTPHAFDLRRALRSERSTLVAIAALTVLYFAKRALY